MLPLTLNITTLTVIECARIITSLVRSEAALPLNLHHNYKLYYNIETILLLLVIMYKYLIGEKP